MEKIRHFCGRRLNIDETRYPPQHLHHLIPARMGSGSRDVLLIQNLLDGGRTAKSPVLSQANLLLSSRHAARPRSIQWKRWHRMNISHGLLLNPLWIGYFGWNGNHFDSLMKTFAMPLLEAGFQISCHVVFHMQLVYDSECYRLGLGLRMVSTGITSFEVWEVQVAL